MKFKPLRWLALAATLPFIQSLSAELPMLKEDPWLGFFAVAKDDKFAFAISTAGDIGIQVVNKGGEPIVAYPVVLQFLATETLPDGSVKDLPMKSETIESTDPATAKLEKTVFRGKLTEQPTGQPTLEVTIEITKAGILSSSRIIDKGDFVNNAVVPVIRVVFPGFYGPENEAKATWERKQVRDFEKMTRKDSVSLKHLDGKTVKLACLEKPTLKPEEINSTGSSLVEVDIGAYQDRKVSLHAAPNSSIVLANAGAAPLHSGFWLQWSADPGKDPTGKAKLAISVK